MSQLAPNRVLDYRWLFLDLNSYFASVEQQLNPQLRGKPIAVIPVETEATCAIAASYEAKACGVKTGTRVYDAKRMCPNITFVLARHEMYVDFHHLIMEELERHLPIESIESIDEAACRLMGPQCNERVAHELAMSIKDGIHQRIGTAIHCSIGIAPNKYLAKVATELEKPNGLVFLKKNTLESQLFPHDVAMLPGIGRAMSLRLARRNIHSIEQLWQLSPKEMRRLWGNVGGERLWYQLRGYDLPAIPTKRSSIGHSHMLAPEWRAADQAYIIAQRLILKAASRARRLGYQAQAMHVSIRSGENRERFQLEKHFYPANDSVTLKNIMSQLWHELMQQSQQQAVRKISITLFHLTPHTTPQMQLFAPPHPKAQRYNQLSSSMDVLNKKYGRDTVVMGFLPKRARVCSGTKIAFNRIPEKMEFLDS